MYQYISLLVFRAHHFVRSNRILSDLIDFNVSNALLVSANQSYGTAKNTCICGMVVVLVTNIFGPRVII